MATVTEHGGGWGFLTRRARVLLTIAPEGDPRLRDIAAACHITERTAQASVTDLEHAAYLRRERDGRRPRTPRPSRASSRSRDVRLPIR
ncbi:hypothetical protein ACFV2Z_38380 [Streptomyces sp. NPDC059688]|uniref:hypothetical protein n=1 Tax=Streptomyces sp. NPDC059688 TaxID=3346906 RepID=UPI0036B99013